MISVVIPAMNESGAIGDTVRQAKAILEEAQLSPYEIIVVNDGSKDDTAAEAEEAGARVLTNPHNLGYGFSLKRGIQDAAYETIVITDADMTYPFEYIPQMLEEKARGFDLVVGARSGKNYRESFGKSILRRILRSFVEYVAGRKIPDINSGLRVFDRSTVMEYFDTLCDTFSFTTSQTLAYMMTGRFVHYISIPYHERAGRTKVRLLRDSFRTMQYILEASLYYNPWKIFTLFSIICILLSIGGFFLSHFAHLQVGYLLGVGGLLVALLVFCAGLLSVQLKHMYEHNKK